jgi:hypothetical protein
MDLQIKHLIIVVRASGQQSQLFSLISIIRYLEHIPLSSGKRKVGFSPDRAKHLFSKYFQKEQFKKLNAKTQKKR